ncbi:MAG: hypothetical protein OXT67_10215, partial [Zetaproteobacteria bacterium]|nr:hypothetical protein [Zetaproteobacteria bacterium]
LHGSFPIFFHDEKDMRLEVAIMRSWIGIRQKVRWGFLSGLYMMQTSFADTSDELRKAETARLDVDPFVSARASGMGGALSTIADGIDAPYYNPALIGGFKEHAWSKESIRGVHFPYLGAAVNENSASLYQQHQDRGAVSPRLVGESLLEVNQGKRQFFRNSGAFSWHWYRIVLLPFYDRQLAAFRVPGMVQGEPNIRVDHLETTGFGYGFSAAARDDSFAIGVFGTTENKARVQGDFTVDELVDTEARSAKFAENTQTYSGNTLHLGALWHLGKKMRPRIAIVNRHVGESQYESSDPSATSLNIPNDLSVGFSFGPKLGKKGRLTWIIEAQKLTQPQVALSKKLKTALEMTLWGPGRDGIVGLRAGYGIAGGSGGLNFNFGVLEFEAAIESRDVGLDYHVVADRRAVASFAIHLLP